MEKRQIYILGVSFTFIYIVVTLRFHCDSQISGTMFRYMVGYVFYLTDRRMLAICLSLGNYLKVVVKRLTKPYCNYSAVTSLKGGAPQNFCCALLNIVFRTFKCIIIRIDI